MRQGALLDIVVNRTIERCGAFDQTPVAQMLAAMMPVPTYAFRSNGLRVPFAECDSAIAFDDYTVGDVVSEETGDTLPYDIFVAGLHTKDIKSDNLIDVSFNVGFILANALIETGLRQTNKLENASIYIMARAFEHVAYSARMRAIGVDSAQFCFGMASSLSQFWTGTPCPTQRNSVMFSRSDFLADIRLQTYLRTMDPSIPDWALLNDAACNIVIPQLCETFSEWTTQLNEQLDEVAGSLIFSGTAIVN